MKLYLDDERRAPRGWVQCDSVADCVCILENIEVDELSLDHDLGGDTTYGTGYDVLCWIEQQVAEDRGYTLPKRIGVHSANPVGRQRMEKVIERIAVRCSQTGVPFEAHSKGVV